jgi:predicted phage baseplate assembly protein
MANVVDATQGETVRNEVLGSSDGSAFQSYQLKQKPLTYLPSTDPEGLAAVQSTLTVMVNLVRWNEQPTLLESSPNAQDFTTTLDDSGQTTVIFGDGVNGARPPTGKNNILARYRKGLGTSGNVASDAIQQLIDSVPGLQKVTNPEPSLGGTDKESISQIRVNAPASLRTFGRAVSAADYAGLALSYPGVAKASAAWILRDAITLQALPQPYVQLTVATVNQAPLTTQFARQLRSFLDKRRDPNVPLRILDFTPIYIDVAAIIDVKDNYPRQATLAAAQAALNPGLNPDNTAGYFAFERLEFGQSIHLSAVYAVLQNVPGVSDVLITTLRRLDQDQDPATVRDDIFIRPTELAVIKNAPSDMSNQFGKAVVSLGKGGFADS